MLADNSRMVLAMVLYFQHVRDVNILVIIFKTDSLHCLM